MSLQVTVLSKGSLTVWAGISVCSDPTGLAVPAQTTSVGKRFAALRTCVRHRACGRMIKIQRESSLFILFRGEVDLQPVYLTGLTGLTGLLDFLRPVYSEETPSEGESPQFVPLLFPPNPTFVASRLFRPAICCKQTFSTYHLLQADFFNPPFVASRLFQRNVNHQG